MIGDWRRFILLTGLVAGATLGMAAAPATAATRAPMKMPNAQLEPVNWDAMEGWSEDDHAAAFATFFKSCQAILRGTKAQREARPLYGALYEACAKAASAKPADANEARA